MEHSRASPWLIEQNRLWRELAGSTITRWVGLDESAGTDDELIFIDRGAPFQQLGALRVEREHEAPLDFGGYQNDDVFGLSLKVSDGSPQFQSEWSRVADLSHLPIGKVDQLEVRIDDRAGTWADLIEVQLSVSGTAVLIVAAEIYPTDDVPDYYWADESFFVFADPTAADAVEWAHERRFTSRIISGERGEVFDT
ncbi:MAG: hypothetical protein KF727_10300 [Microbacteriaceae bacterium]|nr:hypothetical protein [Microbacteriaceae bacterium]